MIVKIIILRLLGSSDDKVREDRRSKTRRAAPTGVPPLAGRGGAAPRGSQGSALKALRSDAPEEPTHKTSVHPMVVGRTDAKSAFRHRLNRRPKKGHRCIGRPMFQRRCQEPRRSFFSTSSTDGASVHTTGVMTSAFRKRSFSTG